MGDGPFLHHRQLRVPLFLLFWTTAIRTWGGAQGDMVCPCYRVQEIVGQASGGGRTNRLSFEEKRAAGKTPVDSSSAFLALSIEGHSSISPSPVASKGGSHDVFEM